MENKDTVNNNPKGFKKILLMFWQYLKNSAYDFVTSFKYNNMKLPAILIALPGLLLGFFISFHAPTVNSLVYDYYEQGETYVATLTEYSSTTDADGNEVITHPTLTVTKDIEGVDVTAVLTRTSTEEADPSTSYNGLYTLSEIKSGYTAEELTKFTIQIDSTTAQIIYRLAANGEDEIIASNITLSGNSVSMTENIQRSLLGFDYSGVILFALMLFGILNIFIAVSMSGKKNLGSVVSATVLTTLITICGIAYIVAIFISYSGFVGGQIQGAAWVWDMNKIMSLATVILSIVSSVTGVVLGYIYYDRTYEKVDR